MALHYGFNITASDMKKLLEENDKQQSGVRSWRQLFGNASLGYEAQSSALRMDYADAMAQAYKANLAQQNTVAGLGLNAGATRAAVGATRADLMNAYNTYIANYNKDAATIGQNYGSEVKTIDTALNERAANFANLYSSAYKYLSEELYGSSRTVNGVTTNLFDDQRLDWAYAKDAQGKPTTELASWDELSTQLFNPDGSITDKGREFFDQMFNQIPQGYTTSNNERTRTFDEWLSAQEDTFANYDATNLPGMAKTGSALREWWVTQDDFNYTRAGANKGTAQAVMGIESTAQGYKPHNYVKVEDVAPMFTDFSNLLSDTRAFVNNTIGVARHEYSELMKASEKKGAGVGSAFAGTGEFVKAGQIHQESVTEALAQMSNLTEQFSTFDAELKKMLGTPVYNEFYQSNQSLYDQINKLLTEMSQESYYARESFDFAKNFNDFDQLNKLLIQLENNLKQIITNSPKTSSGF